MRRVEALFGLAEKLEGRVRAARARVDALPQAILARAFSGRLVPTEAELARREGRSYEPASVLLERIRTERHALGQVTGRRPRASRGVANVAGHVDPGRTVRGRPGLAWPPAHE